MSPLYVIQFASTNYLFIALTVQQHLIKTE